MVAHRVFCARSAAMPNHGRDGEPGRELGAERPALPTRYVRGVLLVLALAASAAACTGAVRERPHAPETRTARVARVIDGDTIVLADGRRVRLVQIDTPELEEHECYGVEAARLLRRLLPAGSAVRLEADSRLDRVDRFGRLLRYVLRGGRILNLVLVRRGAATVWFYDGDRGRYSSALLAAARAARAGRLGLWGACPGTPFDPLHAADTGRP